MKQIRVKKNTRTVRPSTSQDPDRRSPSGKKEHKN